MRQGVRNPSHTHSALIAPGPGFPARPCPVSQPPTSLCFALPCFTSRSYCVLCVTLRSRASSRSVCMPVSQVPSGVLRFLALLATAAASDRRACSGCMGWLRCGVGFHRRAAWGLHLIFSGLDSLWLWHLRCYVPLCMILLRSEFLLWFIVSVVVGVRLRCILGFRQCILQDGTLEVLVHAKSLDVHRGGFSSP